MKTLFTVSLILTVAMLLAVPSMAQLPGPTPGPPPGFYTFWTIALHSPTPTQATGTAQFYVAKPTLTQPPTPKGLQIFSRLSVEGVYLIYKDLTPLDIYIGPGRTPSEPFGKLVGQMPVMGGSATWLTARPPVVKKGTTITIVHDGAIVMHGRF